MKWLRSVKKSLAATSHGDKKKIILIAAVVIALVWLNALYALGGRAVFGRLSAARNEIGTRLRILEIKKRNYDSLEHNLAALGGAAERRAQNKTASAGDLPEAVVYIAGLMKERGVAEKDFSIHHGSAYGDGVFRQPVSLSGTASAGDALGFVEALLNGRFYCEISDASITGDPNTDGDERGSEPVTIRMDIVIMVLAE